MKKIKTLKKNYEFKNVLKKGRFYKGKYITIYITKNNKSENIIGIAISKKLCKATKRNRLKRLIREGFRKQKETLKKGYNIVFIWNKNADIKEASFYNVNNDIKLLFTKAGIIK